MRKAADRSRWDHTAILRLELRRLLSDERPRLEDVHPMLEKTPEQKKAEFRSRVSKITRTVLDKRKQT